MSDLTPRDASTRAADTDRIQVAQLLTDAAAQGRLPLSEYEKRLAEAYAAKTYDELDRLTDDLPGLPEPAHGRGAEGLEVVGEVGPRCCSPSSAASSGAAGGTCPAG